MKRVLAVAVVLLGCSPLAAEPGRDPFRRPVVRADESRPTPCRAASCQLDTSSLQVVAVMTGDANPTAMLEDAAGHAVVVRRNSPIGREGARVEQIERGNQRTCVHVVRFVSSNEGPLRKQTTPYCLQDAASDKPALDYLSGRLR